MGYIKRAAVGKCQGTAHREKKMNTTKNEEANEEESELKANGRNYTFGEAEKFRAASRRRQGRAFGNGTWKLREQRRARERRSGMEKARSDAAVTVERVHFRSAKQLPGQPSEEDCAKPSTMSPTHTQ